MKLTENCLLTLVLFLSVATAARRRAHFKNCPASKSDNDLMITKLARSRIECSKFCLDDPQCMSASYCKTADGFMCQLSGFYTGVSCTGLIPDVNCIQTTVVGPCENGGTFVPTNRTCHCVEGFLGDYCQRRTRDCIETKQVTGTFYFIEPLQSDNVFRWMCVPNYTFITYIRSDYANKTYPYSWQQFKDGLVPLVWGTPIFFFCGLEFLHLLTSQGMYDMFIILSGNNNSNGKLWYRNFRVDSEANHFSLSWDHVELDAIYPESYKYLDGFGGAGDGTKSLNGARFGTFDNDVNGCASANNAGWWYNPIGCTALKFEEAGWSWPTNRSGTVVTELLQGTIMGIQPVFWYMEDDLVF